MDVQFTSCVYGDRRQIKEDYRKQTNWWKQTRITVRLIEKREEMSARSKMQQENDRDKEREKRKYLDPKKPDEFKKKEG